MKSTDVSFVVPAQLSARTLGQTLESIINQRTQLTFEIIVIVDESHSSTTDHHQVAYIKAPLKGASAARNLGIKESSGKMIAFVDGDTVLNSDWLEKLHAAMVAGNWCAAQGRIQTIGNIAGSFFTQFREISTKVHNDCMTLAHYPFPIINSAACLYAKDALQLFDESVMSAEDVELSWRVLHKDERGFLYLDSALATCSYDPENYWEFLKRNFKVGRSLKKIALCYGSSFEEHFSKSMWASFQRECFLLADCLSVAMIMRLLATAVTRIGYVTSAGALTAEENPMASEVRFIQCETLRTLNLRTFQSQYIKNFELLIDSNGRKKVIGGMK